MFRAVGNGHAGPVPGCLQNSPPSYRLCAFRCMLKDGGHGNRTRQDLLCLTDRVAGSVVVGHGRMRDGGAASYLLVLATETSSRAAVPPCCRGRRMRPDIELRVASTQKVGSGWAGLARSNTHLRHVDGHETSLLPIQRAERGNVKKRRCCKGAISISALRCNALRSVLAVHR